MKKKSNAVSNVSATSFLLEKVERYMAHLDKDGNLSKDFEVFNQGEFEMLKTLSNYYDFLNKHRDTLTIKDFYLILEKDNRKQIQNQVRFIFDSFYCELNKDDKANFEQITKFPKHDKYYDLVAKKSRKVVGGSRLYIYNKTVPNIGPADASMVSHFFNDFNFEQYSVAILSEIILDFDERKDQDIYFIMEKNINKAKEVGCKYLFKVFSSCKADTFKAACRTNGFSFSVRNAVANLEILMVELEYPYFQ